MKIEVNNGCTLELVEANGGLSAISRDEKGNTVRRDHFDAGEIVAVMNVLRYMRDEDQKEVYLFDEDTRNYLRNLIANGDITDFRIFQ